MNWQWFPCVCLGIVGLYGTVVARHKLRVAREARARITRRDQWFREGQRWLAENGKDKP